MGKKKLYVPVDFESGQTIDALVDSGAYVSATAESELEGIKHWAPTTSSKFSTL